MAQAATLSAPPVPPPTRYGSSFSAIYEVVTSLPHDQVCALNDAYHTAHHRDDYAAYGAALDRLDVVLGLLGVQERDDDLAQDVAFAMLARDRGLINEADFTTITTAWVAAGLPLPATSTGDVDDDVPVTKMTTDRICDELAHTAVDTPNAGAVLALTGYNYGELLSYDIVREFIVKDGAGLQVRWSDLDYALNEEGGFPAEGVLSGEALGFLAFAVSMATVAGAAMPGSQNAEVMTLAVSYALNTHRMIDTRWDNDSTPEAAASPTPPASDPGE